MMICYEFSILKKVRFQNEIMIKSTECLMNKRVANMRYMCEWDGIYTECVGV